MAKNLKLNIKNTQIAQAIDLGGLKSKLSEKMPLAEGPLEEAHESSVENAKKREKAPKKESAADVKKETVPTINVEKDETPAPRVRARTKSAFSEPAAQSRPKIDEDNDNALSLKKAKKDSKESHEQDLPRQKSNEELRMEIFGKEPRTDPTLTFKAQEDKVTREPEKVTRTPESIFKDLPAEVQEPKVSPPPVQKVAPGPTHSPPVRNTPYERPVLRGPLEKTFHRPPPRSLPNDRDKVERVPYEKLGPTGRHVKDLIPPPRPAPRPPAPRVEQTGRPPYQPRRDGGAPGGFGGAGAPGVKPRFNEGPPKEATDKAEVKKPPKPLVKGKEFRDVKPARKPGTDAPVRTFDARDRQGLRSSEEDRGWRRRRPACACGCGCGSGGGRP